MHKNINRGTAVRTKKSKDNPPRNLFPLSLGVLSLAEKTDLFIKSYVSSRKSFQDFFTMPQLPEVGQTVPILKAFFMPTTRIDLSL